MPKNKNSYRSNRESAFSRRIVRKIAPAIAAASLTAACSLAPEAQPDAVTYTKAIESLPADTAIEQAESRQYQFSLSEILSESGKLLEDTDVITATSIDYGYDELSLLDVAEDPLPILSIMDVDGELTLFDKSPNGINPEFLATIASLFAIDEARHRQVLDALGVISYDIVVGTSENDIDGTFRRDQSAVIIELPYGTLNHSVIDVRTLLIHEGFHGEESIPQTLLSDEDLNLVCGQLTNIAQQELAQNTDEIANSLDELVNLGAPASVIEPIKQAVQNGSYYSFAQDLLAKYLEVQGLPESTGEACFNGGIAESVSLGLELHQPGSYSELMGEYEIDGFSGAYNRLAGLHHDLAVTQTIFSLFTEQSYHQDLEGNGWPYRTFDELQASIRTINYLFPDELANHVAAIQDPATRQAAQQAIDFVLAN